MAILIWWGYEGKSLCAVELCVLNEMPEKEEKHPLTNEVGEETLKKNLTLHVVSPEPALIRLQFLSH